MKLLASFIFLLFIPFPVLSNDSTPITVNQMHEDIDFYFKTVEENNPAIYRRFSKRFLDSIQNHLKTECNIPLPIEEFNYRLAKTNKYFDGHTGISPTFLKDDGQKFPFVEFSEGLIIQNSILTHIEGIEAKQISDDLDKMTAWEFNDKGHLRFINMCLNGLLQGYYKLEPPYNCSIRNNITSEIKDTIIHTIDYKKWYKKYQPMYDSTYHTQSIDCKYYVKDSIAIFYYNTSLEPVKDQVKLYDSFVSGFFKTIKENDIKYLFIDVTQNGGGSDNTHEYLYKHLKSKSYARKGTVYNNMQMKSEGRLKKGKKEEKYNFEYDKEGNNIGFGGKVFVLMAWQTYSAAADFCEEVKRRQIGILIGEESTQRFPYPGNARTDVLPHSKIPFRYATSFFIIEPDITNSQGFIEPDIPYPMEHPFELEDYKNIIELYKSRIY